MSKISLLSLLAVVAVAAGGCSAAGDARSSGSADSRPRAAARMIRASEGTLSPVYGPLAEQIAADFHLAGVQGVGVDVGGGPGTLIVELCRHTELHWINADINPFFFDYFYRLAGRPGFGDRVSAIPADVHELPFRDDYADFVVSRGSFPFWSDKVRGFAEIYRIMKPGAKAYIGRGFSENLPIETARKIRAGQGGKMKYDRGEAADELRGIMEELGIKEYRIHRPKSDAREAVNYGIWIEFVKAREAGG